MRTRSSFPARASALTLLAFAIASCGGSGGSGGGGGGGGGPLNITTVVANDGVVGVAYNLTVAVTGGNGTRTYSVSAGTLPPGLTLSAAGAIGGTPTGPTGTANFSVSVTDSATPPATDTQALSIDVVDPLAITTATLPTTSVGENYSAAVVVTGGTAAYAFGVGPGSLPSGLGIGADGVVAGTVAPDARSEVFSVFVDDDTFPPQNDSQEYEIDVELEITTSALRDAIGGEVYAASLGAQGGLLPLSWSLTAGALPAGLTGPDPASGAIGGTADPVCIAANAVLTARVVDSDTPPFTDTQAGINLTVNPAVLEITNSSLPAGSIGTTYDATVQAAGGVPPYAVAVSAGVLPSGLVINETNGRITGTPDTLETQAFSVTVTDSCPNSITRAFGITINAAVLGRNDSIADATVLPGNGIYSASISPSGHPNTVFDPDEDFYAITTTAASTITVDINASVNGSPLDSVIEILSANGTQLSTCLPPAMDGACKDDDAPGSLLDSLLQVQVGGATTIYIHVVDFGGSARPDKLYDLVISGVN